MKMSRRKQARPIRHLEDEEALNLQINSSSTNGRNSTSGSEDEISPNSCRHCRIEISSLADLLGHRKDCIPKYGVCDDETSEPEDIVVSGDEEEACSEGGKRQEAVRRQQQDAENNNSIEGEEDGETDMNGSMGYPFPALGGPGHVTLEALQNTKVAVAQFAANALATNGDNPAALQELAVLQSTLFTLQHQQMMQLSLIQQLQNHLTVHPKEDGSVSPSPSSNASSTPGVPIPAVLPVQQPPAKCLRIPTPVKAEHPPSPPTSQSIPATHKPHHLQQQPLTIPKPPPSRNSPIPPPMPLPNHPPICSISSSLASSIITNNDPPPPLNEPNTLEMLQKRAQEVLDNASQGLLANNLADELAFRKNGKNSLSSLSGGRNEPFFKHRCRYCGKVFGSDSALQIHIRSHTGERPFKCNVCGSRFTTKGNLKVHFQRHTSKFPHIKMNPNPVPEHLDKFHPPLLAQMSSQNLPPGMSSHQNHSHRPSLHHAFPNSSAFPPPGLTLFRPPLPHDLIPRPTMLPTIRPHESNLLKPLLPLSIFAPRDQQDLPENLTKSHSSSSPSKVQEKFQSRSRSHSPAPIKQESVHSVLEDKDKEKPLRNQTFSTERIRRESKMIDDRLREDADCGREEIKSKAVKSAIQDSNETTKLEQEKKTRKVKRKHKRKTSSGNSNNNNNHNSSVNDEDEEDDEVDDDEDDDDGGDGGDDDDDDDDDDVQGNTDEENVDDVEWGDDEGDEDEDEEDYNFGAGASACSDFSDECGGDGGGCEGKGGRIERKREKDKKLKTNRDKGPNKTTTIMDEQEKVKKPESEAQMSGEEEEGERERDKGEQQRQVEQEEPETRQVEHERDEQEDERLSPGSKVRDWEEQEMMEAQEKRKIGVRNERMVCISPGRYDDCSVDTKYSDDFLEDNSAMSPSGGEKMDERFQEQPENLSSKLTESRPSYEPSDHRLISSVRFPNSSPHSSNSSGSVRYHIPHETGPPPSEIDPAKDPAIYNSLLPRPGSNDNSWESLIEVTKTSETYKLQQLVDNIEHKLTDPNQCVICHRVLSCKSALQMHYRTHTGERPFRCKICGRAFTTKGNLKTHMGVHRLKPPMRVLHQCPVCHKKFTNSLVLQQHIRLHTGEPTDLTPEQIHAAEIKEYPHPGSLSHPSFLGHGFPLSGLPSADLHIGIPPNADHDMEIKDERQDDDMYDDDDDDDDFSNSSDSQQQHFPSFSSSISPVEPQVRAVSAMSSEMNRVAEDLTVQKPVSICQMNGTRSPGCAELESPCESECRISPSPPRSETPLNIPRPPILHPPSSPSDSESNSLGALDLTPRASAMGSQPVPQPGIFSGLGLMQSNGSTSLMTSALSSLTSSVLTSTTFSPLGMAVGPAVRGNTTCNICFKTFACNSALEIHYRSHTKERPFKCTICDRGFSTKIRDKEDWCIHEWRIQEPKSRYPPKKNKNRSNNSSIASPLGLPVSGYATDWMHQGNMKQHMLTHKIRDMPPHLFENKKSPPYSTPPAPQSEDVDVSDASNSNAMTEEPKQGHSSRLDLPELPVKVESSTPPPIKRSTSEGELPVSKRQSSMPKHLCHVCNKNFSSSSALQIHMRTHTGDKPFRCTVCQKAFTTKGNLKVHMGTHMWSNGASRRGRRMSLDLPPIPMNPKDSEFLQRRPDLFYPYLPAPFLNGVQQKLNEMSLIQPGSLNPNNGLSQAGGKFGSVLGFSGFNGPDMPLRLDSVEKQDPSPPLALSMSSHRRSPPPGETIVGDEMPRGVWDLHFESKSNSSEDHIDMSSSPGRHMPLASQRGEELAAYNT